jgi:DNA sulfur modification protein DndD
MTIDEIIIQNFGIYQNPKPIDLRTTRKQPIVLFGGLNGGGKTTLLDAILLCLYGPMAKTSNRGNKGYHAYLRDSLNRHTEKKEAFVELTFRHHRDGNEDRFKIRRQWTVGKTVQETLTVEINKQEDLLLQENWLNFIDELIPSQVANLFFFDGEKIEQFADLENAQQLLESALHSLLGLDVLNQLGLDLKTLEQRKRIARRSSEEQKELQEQQQILEGIANEIRKLTDQMAGARTDLIRVQANLKKEKAKYSRLGGDLFEQREKLFEDKSKLKRDLQAAKATFVQLASTETPLLLVGNLIAKIVQQAGREESAQQAEMIVSMLAERDKKTLSAIEKLAGKEAKNVLAKQLDADRDGYQKAASTEQYLKLTDEGRRQIRKAEGLLPSAKQQFQKITETIADLEEKIERADKKIQSMPDSETIKPIKANCERWENEHLKLSARISILEEEAKLQSTKAERLQATIFNRLGGELDAKLQGEDDQRVIVYSEKVRVTLETLKQKVVDQRLTEIEDLILHSFKQLIRKSKLIGKIRISPENFSLTLFDSNQQEIHPDRLSAGERQLLAVSILWGLAKAAGLPLPVVIDTPLGRLDGEHRNKLLDFYFPHASHQVLILSTDTEIAKHHYAQLKPFIKKSYRIEYNPETQASEISEGYQFS